MGGRIVGGLYVGTTGDSKKAVCQRMDAKFVSMTLKSRGSASLELFRLVVNAQIIERCSLRRAVVKPISMTTVNINMLFDVLDLVQLLRAYCNKDKCGPIAVHDLFVL